MEIRTKARQWGSSIAVILPKAFVDSKRIKPNDEVILEVRKNPLAGNFFGKFPIKNGKSVQEIKDEMRKGWH